MGLWCLICPSWSGFSRPLRSPGGPTDSWYAPTTLLPPSACPLSVPLAEIANKIPLIRWGTTVLIGLPLLQLSILNLYVNRLWSLTNLLHRFHENRIQLMGWVKHRVGNERVFCVCVCVDTTGSMLSNNFVMGELFWFTDMAYLCEKNFERFHVFCWQQEGIILLTYNVTLKVWLGVAVYLMKQFYYLLFLWYKLHKTLFLEKKLHLWITKSKRTCTLKIPSKIKNVNVLINYDLDIVYFQFI